MYYIGRPDEVDAHVCVRMREWRFFIAGDGLGIVVAETKFQRGLSRLLLGPYSMDVMHTCHSTTDFSLG